MSSDRSTLHEHIQATLASLRVSRPTCSHRSKCAKHRKIATFAGKSGTFSVFGTLRSSLPLTGTSRLLRVHRGHDLHTASKRLKRMNTLYAVVDRQLSISGVFVTLDALRIECFFFALLSLAQLRCTSSSVRAGTQAR